MPPTAAPPQEQSNGTKGRAPETLPAPQTLPAPRVPEMRLDIEPVTVDEAYRLAQYIANSDLVPAAYKGKPGDILIAIKKGKEIGLPAMAAIHNIVVLNGRPEVWGDGLLGVIVASPFYKDHDEYYLVGGERREFLLEPDLNKDDTTAVTTFWRSDNPRPKSAAYTIANAKKAGLWKKAGSWQTNPDRMLRYRARGFAAGDCFPDVLTGVARPGWGPVGAPPVVIDTPVNEPPRIVRRISETKAAEPEPAPAEPAAVEIEIVGTVKDVEQFMGGFTVTLGDGTKVDMTEGIDALELEKMKGTAYKVRLTCDKPVDGTPTLKSFAIAD